MLFKKVFGKSKIRRRKENFFTKTVSEHREELIGVLSLGVVIFIGLSLFSYNPNDNSWFHFASNNQKITNSGGFIGAHLSALLFYLWGSAAYVVLALCAYVSSLVLFKGSLKEHYDRIISLSLFTLVVTVLLRVHGLDFTKSYPGGYVGYSVQKQLFAIIGRGGAIILLYSLLWISGVVFLRVSLAHSLVATGNAIMHGLGDLYYALKSIFLFMYKRVNRYRVVAASKFVKNEDTYIPQKPVEMATDHEEEFEEDFEEELFEEEHDILETTKRNAEKVIYREGYVVDAWKNKAVFLRNSVFAKNIFSLADEMKVMAEKAKPVRRRKKSKYSLPDLSVFTVSETSEERAALEKECKERAFKLEEKLAHFGIEGKVTSILPGPVVTLFEYTPEIGTKISKILALEDDLAMVLKALSIRIIAPIPGRSVVGFEISNEARESVYLSDIILGDKFQRSRHALPLVLGVDIVGKAIIADLLSMPHLLVAGSTGSGKSVGLNAMLVSLLCRLRPDEMKLILIDPKRLEFATYDDIPHLLFPIVTDPRKVPVVLKWVVQEMERRYELMAEAGVRNLSDYKKLDDPELESLPFIVVMIDELADLMMVAGKDVEMYITRIAQMARAAGIHMIIATQRPSVDVLTGLIKVNFPSRISFKVTSKVDSKTILDSVGAEKLLGKGDMLCSDPKSSGLRRVHGAFVSDEEISKLTAQLRMEKKPDYLDMHELEAEAAARVDDVDDDLYDEVVDFVKTQEEISISMLQRKYRIGFNRSARLIESLESRGIVAPAQGGKPRKVIR